jgi:methionine biosynthesis protein MetW
MKKIILFIIDKLKLNILINDFREIFMIPKIIYDEMDYNKYWENREKENTFQYRWPLMISEIENNSSVLDIGCGDGGFLALLKENNDNIKETGIDISKTGIERAVTKNLNALVRTLNWYDDKENVFDYVVLSEVIEHVENSEYFVLRGFDLAKKKLIITIPNTGYYTYRLRLLFGSFPVQWVHHPGEHLRFWTIRDFKSWINGLNLKDFKGDIKIKPSNGIPYFNLYKILPSLFCKQLVFIIEK